jgi:hypothetical protein
VRFAIDGEFHARNRIEGILVRKAEFKDGAIENGIGGV